MSERVTPQAGSLRALAVSTERLPGIGPRTAAALSRKGIHSVEDLLFFLPRAYDDRRSLVPVEALRVGQTASFRATVTRSEVRPMRGGRRVFQAVVSDGTAAVQLKWFRGLSSFESRVRPGVPLLISGTVRRYRYAKELHHPEIEVLAEGSDECESARIVPVYPVVEGVPPRSIRRVVEAAVTQFSGLVDAYLPADLVRSLALPEVGEAIRRVHMPGTELDTEELSERRTRFHLRLVAEELFLLQLGLELRRGARQRRPGKPLDVDAPAVRRALAALPFTLTADQQRAWSEIAADLALPHPMNRLLIGDVGTGKTVLAFLASVAAQGSRGLTAVLAPTEILAEQHLRTFRQLAGPLGARAALLTGSTRTAERRVISRALRAGECSVLIGTHALLETSLDLPRLRLVVIDEQHRFGVQQRRELGGKGEHPHVLVMTATPIPRTLALTLFGDLDQSVLRERPPGRRTVRTRVLRQSESRTAFEKLREVLGRGEQAYVVYPLVDESESQDLRNATRGFARLQQALPGTRLALLHGRMDAEERLRIMGAFQAGRVQLLVTTTVIEVGVDVPQATLLIVQHAERFGLAQLHQLRGRVGRGDRGGQALLIGEPRTEGARRRLAILERIESGFEIADEDLRIRGAGEWLGTRQAGHLPELRLADLVRHAELLPPVRDAAIRLLREDPELRRAADLRAAVERRWGSRLDLGAIA